MPVESGSLISQSADRVECNQMLLRSSLIQHLQYHYCQVCSSSLQGVLSKHVAYRIHFYICVHFQIHTIHLVIIWKTKMDLTGDKGNFCKLTEVILTIIPKYLRQYFKDEWDKAYSQMIWNDSPADGKCLTSKIKIKYPFNDLKNTLAQGNRNDWDPTALFFVLCKSGVIIPHCRDPPKRVAPLRASENIDKLRTIRNEFFAHRSIASISLIEFNRVIIEIENVFKIFNWQNGLLEIDTVKKVSIKTPLSQSIQQQLDAAIQFNDSYHALERDVRGLQFSSFIFAFQFQNCHYLVSKTKKKTLGV